MSTISPTDVKRIAILGRLALSEKETEQAAAKLDGILANFSAIQAVDTAKVPSSDNVTGLQNITRTDEVIADALCSPADLIAAAPKTSGSHIKVKAVFEEQTL